MECDWRCPECNSLFDHSVNAPGAFVCSNIKCRTPIVLGKKVLRGRALERAEAPVAREVGVVRRSTAKAFKLSDKPGLWRRRRKADQASVMCKFGVKFIRLTRLPDDAELKANRT